MVNAVISVVDSIEHNIKVPWRAKIIEGGGQLVYTEAQFLGSGPHSDNVFECYTLYHKKT